MRVLDMTARIVSQRQLRVSFWLVIDFVIVFVAYLIALFSRSALTEINMSAALPALALASLIMLVCLYMFGVYRRLWARTSGHGITVILYGVVLGTIVIAVADSLLVPRPVPLSVVLVGSVFALGGMIAVRYRSRLISGLSWRWRAVWHSEFPPAALATRVLIVGAGESGQDLVWRLKHRFPHHNYKIIGFIDDDDQKQGMLVEGCPVLGKRAALVQIAAQERIDLIVVAIHNIGGQDFREILELCEQTQARIKVLPDLFKLVRSRSSDVPLRDIQPEDLLGRSVVSRHKDVDMSPVIGRRVLITGAAGSIGSELSRQMIAYEPTQLILLDNNESGLHDLWVELHAQHPQVNLLPVLLDIASLEQIRALFKVHHPQIVFHAAAYKHVPMLEYYPQEALRVNINGTLNLAEMAVTYDVERFVLVSTDKAVKPNNIMGASKRVGELLLHAMSQEAETQTRFAAVRFGNVLGSRGSVIPTFNRQIDSGGPVTVTHPEMTRYFMSIPEAANLIIHAACLTVGDEIFVLNMGEVVRIVDLAERMIRLRGLRPYKDIDIRFTGVRPGEKLHEKLFYDDENPTATIHPNIVKLDNWPHNFDPTHFFDQIVRIVIQNQDTTAGEILQQLLTIIQADQPPAQASSQDHPNPHTKTNVAS
jgi:FlaA1/EpsC-like NDP-sugar epimerase